MKFLINLIILFLIPNLVWADEPLQITLGGGFEVSTGSAINQKDAFKDRIKYSRNEDDLPVKGFSPWNTGNNNNFGIFSNTSIDINIIGVSSLGFSYGGKLGLNADTSVSLADNDDFVADETMLYFSGKYGRIEGGAYESIAKQWQVSANSIARGTGGIKGTMRKMFGKGPRVNVSAANEPHGAFGQRYILVPRLSIDCDCISNSNRITYMSPQIHGLQAGISYAPDVAVHGTLAKQYTVGRRNGRGFEHLINYALIYEKQLEHAKYKFGLNGEIANSKGGDVEVKGLKTWELGAVISHEAYSIAGSFSNWGKSATPVIKAADKKYGAKYWTLGVGYEKEKLGASLTYFRSLRANVFTVAPPSSTEYHDYKHNRLEYLVLSLDYKLAEGLLTYLELGRFKAKDSKIQGNKGNVLLLGTKLKF